MACVFKSNNTPITFHTVYEHERNISALITPTNAFIIDSRYSSRPLFIFPRLVEKDVKSFGHFICSGGDSSLSSIEFYAFIT